MTLKDQLYNTFQYDKNYKKEWTKKARCYKKEHSKIFQKILFIMWFDAMVIGLDPPAIGFPVLFSTHINRDYRTDK